MRASTSAQTNTCTSRCVGPLTLTLGLCGTFVAFFVWAKQPIVYDASSYCQLSRQLAFPWGLPSLENGGFRSYGYPLLLRPFVAALPDKRAASLVYVVQFSVLFGLMFALRRKLLPAHIRADAVLTALWMLLPVLIPYCLVVLSDVPAAVFLQGSILVLVLASCQPLGLSSTGWFLCSGLLLGFAQQIRPVYFHLTWPALAFAAFAQAKSDGPARPSRWLIQRMRFIAVLVGVVVAAAPTMTDNIRQGNGPRLLPEVGPLVAYHMVLGLWLDRWSSNPPPIEEKLRAARDWSAHGWMIDSSDPARTPTLRDLRRLVAIDPARAARQWSKHVYHAFQKWEIFPYRGAPPAWWSWQIWIANWLVLVAFVHEAGQCALSSSEPCFARRFAGWQLLLLAYLIGVNALIVPEERFTLAIYPAALVFATRCLLRTMSPAEPAHAQGGS